MFQWSRLICPVEWRVLLVAAEVNLKGVLVVPSLTNTCQPVVYLTGLTDSARRQVADILRGGAGPPLSARQSVHDFSRPPTASGK